MRELMRKPARLAAADPINGPVTLDGRRDGTFNPAGASLIVSSNLTRFTIMDH